MNSAANRNSGEPKGVAFAGNRPLDPIPDESFAQFREAADGKPASVRFLAFNTVVDVEAYGEPEACKAAFLEAIRLCRSYERLFSRTLPHSDISRINGAAGQPVAVDPLTYDLVSKALRYCEQGEGAFDITVGPLVRLWDFHAGKVADAAALAEAARHVNWRNVELWQEPAAEQGEKADGGTCLVRMADPQAMLDVGGIAKGWIADALVEALEPYGFGGLIVNLGGNVAVHGSKPSGEPWRVGVRDPRNPEQLIGAVPLANGSAVTSGIYERTFTGSDGRTYHHILNPRTGMPADTDVAGVTLLAERSIDAEGFSTTLLALGTERGIALVHRHPEIDQAFFVDRDGLITPAWS